MPIDGPPPDSEDFFKDCEKALVKEFLDLCRKAENAGWDQFVVASALTHLGQQHMLAIKAEEMKDEFPEFAHLSGLLQSRN